MLMGRGGEKWLGGIEECEGRGRGGIWGKEGWVCNGEEGLGVV